MYKKFQILTIVYVLSILFICLFYVPQKAILTTPENIPISLEKNIQVTGTRDNKTIIEADNSLARETYYKPIFIGSESVDGILYAGKRIYEIDVYRLKTYVFAFTVTYAGSVAILYSSKLESRI